MMQIEYPARCSHHNIYAIEQFFYLWLLLEPTGYAGSFYFCILANLRQGVVNLHGELTGRFHNDGQNSMRLLGGFLAMDQVYEGNGKSSRFAGTGLRNSQHIFSFENWRNCFVLNIGRSPEIQPFQAAFDLRSYGIVAIFHVEIGKVGCKLPGAAMAVYK